MQEQWDATAVHDVHRGLTLVNEGIDVLLGSRAWSLTAAEVVGVTGQLATQRARLEAAYLSLVRALVDRSGGERPDARAAETLQRSLRLDRGRARADVRAAQLLDPTDGDLRELAVALEQGDVSREHVDVARRAIERLPVAVVRDQRETVSHALLEHARHWSPGSSELLARHLVAVAAPERTDRFDPEDLERRCWSHAVDGAGMLQVRGQLPPTAAVFTRLVDHLASPLRGLDAPDVGQLPAVPEDAGAAAGNAGAAAGDTRTAAQRRADAVALIGRLAAERLGMATDGGTAASTAVPRVVVHTTVEQLAAAGGRPDPAAGIGAATCEGLGPLRRGALQRLACDAVLERVVLAGGALQELTTLGRLATPAQRRALVARDGGCVFPGCDAPTWVCDAHHVVWWTRGGPTDVANLALLCQRHHDVVHAGEWEMRMADGVPELRPPPWVEPARSWLRNTLHRAVAQAQRSGHELRLRPGDDIGRPP
jgi:hypothetical protein